MLSELTLLLHEMSDSLRGRVEGRRPALSSAPAARDVARATKASHTTSNVVLVTGLASPGKTRLVEALRRRLEPATLTVRVGATRQLIGADAAIFHVHAETDLDAMVEGGLQSIARHASRDADLLVPVDWERVEHSVNRVIDALIARGVDVDAPGD